MTLAEAPLRLHDLPIPTDVKANSSWPPTLLDLAYIVGPYDALRICDVFGGNEVYFGVRGQPPEKLVELLGADKAAAIHQEYLGLRVSIPTAKAALFRARRGSVISAVLANKMTRAEGAKILGITENYMRKLAKMGDEGHDAAPLVLKRKGDHRQMDMFGEE